MVTSKRVALLAAVLLLLIPGTHRLVSTQSATAPILLVTNSASSNPFGGYLAEVLRTEGLPAFSTSTLSSLTASQLSTTPLVVLAETSLSASQVNLLSNYVAGGGRLVAMRPPAGLASVLGLTSVGTSMNGGYVGINTSIAVGSGFTSLTLPFRGTADRYTLNGATSLATLYSNQTTATTFPAVTRFGNTVAWTFDLARSVAYTRQGNPAFAGQERDGEAPIRTTDIFFNDLDLDRVRIPHADIMMRLFSRTITELLADSVPMPKLWYFPGNTRTMMVVTSDTHQPTVDATQAVVNAVTARGGHVSSYVPRWTNTDAGPLFNTWRTLGHEFGYHAYAYGDGVNLDTALTTNQDWFEMHDLGTPARTTRQHQIEWQGWATAAQVQANHGIAMDTSFYTWGPSVNYADTYPNGRHRQAHGFITGSGLPMRFVTETGTIVPVYQQVTSLIDEQLVNNGSPYTESLTPEEALVVSHQLIDDSQAGGYSALMTQFHADYYGFGEVQPWADGTMDYAVSLGIPLYSAGEWLTFTESRNATVIASPTWAAASRQLSFTVKVPVGGRNQTMTVPSTYAGRLVSSVFVDGVATPYITQAIIGRDLVFFTVTPRVDTAARSVVVTYNATAPNQPPVAVTDTAGTPLNTAVAVPVLANDYDPDGDGLTVTAVGTPARGTASVTGGGTTVTFTPTTALCGPDTFSYSISDGRGGSATGSLTVTVGCPANTPPTANADSTTTPFNTAVTIAVLTNDTDPNGDPLAVQSVGAAPRGTTTIAPGGAGVVYTPTPGLCGPDSFTYTVTDGRGGLASANVTVTVSCGGNRTQTTVADFAGCSSIATGTQVTSVGNGEVRLSGGFGDEYTAAALDPKWTAGTWTGAAYTPTFSGGVMSLGGAAGAFVRSTATQPVSTLDARAAISASPWQHLGWGALDFAGDNYAMFSTYNQGTRLYARTNLGTGEQRTDLGAIPAGFHLYRIERVTAVDASEHFRYFVDGALLIEHIVTGATAQPMYVYQSHNGGSGAPLMQVDSITISPPYVASGTFDSCPIDAGTSVTWSTASWVATTPAGTTLALRTRTSNDATNWSAWSLPVAANGGPVTSPAARYAQYRIELATTVPAATPFVDSVTLDFQPSAGAPNAQNDSATTAFNTPVTVPVRANDSDPNGDPLTVTGVGPAARGVASISGGGTTVTYTPTTGLCGPDSFTYTIGDGTGGTASAVVTITVACPANVPPTAVADSTTTGFNTAVTIDVRGNDSDANGDPLTVTAVSTPARGTATITAGGASVLYTPTTGLCGPDTFNYTVSDGQGGSTSAAVTVAVGCGTALVHTTYADFAACTPTQVSTQVTRSVDGEVRLGANYGDDYSAALLDPKWTAGTWAGTPYVPVTVGGVMSLGGAAGAYVRSTNTLPVTALEFRAQIGAAPWQHLGWGALDFSGDQYVMFSTFVSSTNLFIRSNVGGGETRTDLGPIPTGFHTYRIERTTAPDTTEHLRYLIDGVIVGEHVLTGAVPALYIYQSHNAATATPTLDIDSVGVSPPYAPAGTFDSCTMDAGVPVTFTTASWTGTVPAGTTLAVRTRTSDDASTWSEWSAPLTSSGAAITSPGGRYAQYRLEMTSTVADLSPIVESVTIGSSGSTGTVPAISAGTASVTEGNTGTTVLAFPVTLSATSNVQVKVNYATANGTASQGTDYTPVSGTLTFPAGTTTQTVNVTVLGDTGFEANETVLVALSSPVNATIGTSPGVGTILNDDAAPVITVSSPTVTEGNAGSSNATFNVTLSAASGQTITVTYATANGTATAGSDYTTTGGTLTFVPGATTQLVTVPVLGDTLDEANETFTLGLSAAVNATVGAPGVATISDDDASPSLTIGNTAAVTEGNTGSTNSNFTVTLSAVSGQVVTVAYAATSGTATVGADFAASAGTLTFNAGETSKTITVAVLGDTLDEDNETYTVELSSPVNATIADGSGSATINDNDATTQQLSIGNAATVTEGAGVTSNFTVTLSPVSGRQVTVNYSANSGTATSGVDFTATGGTLTFAPGETSKVVAVPIIDDLSRESAENFTVGLSSATNASINDNSGSATINDNNDPVPTLSIADASLTEGNSGSANMTFTVTLSQPTSFAVSVQYATSNGSATSGTGNDYTARSGTINFAAGDTSETFTVSILGDTRYEGNETFNVTLSSPNANATIADNLGIGTIIENDPQPTLSIGNVTVLEPNSGSTNANFTVTLSAASTQTVTVFYQTNNGTAVAPGDYSTRSGTLTFSPGTTSQTIAVPVLSNSPTESSETFTVTLSLPTNTTISDNSGTCTIFDF